MANSLLPGCQAMSDLLTIREKGVLLTLLGPQCKLLKATVAQVLAAAESRAWSLLGCGVLCLVEDQSAHSYFLRLYCVKAARTLWQQELYIPFKYTAAQAFFHTFPADGHQAGLNFANEAEAEEFHLAVEAVLRHQEQMTGMIEMPDNGPLCDPIESRVKLVDLINREQLSPTGEPVTPTSSSDLDPAMRKLLMQAQLTEEDLKDKDVTEAVDCIIEKFGGLKAVRTELNSGPFSQTWPSTPAALDAGHGPTLNQPTPSAPVSPDKIRGSATFKPEASTAAGPERAGRTQAAARD